MFDAKDLECLDPEYFSIIMVNEYDVTVMSRNTGHYWYVIVPVFLGILRVLYSININITILTTSMVLVTVSGRLSGAFRVTIYDK